MIRVVELKDYARLGEIWASTVLVTHDFLAWVLLPHYFQAVSLWAC